MSCIRRFISRTAGDVGRKQSTAIRAATARTTSHFLSQHQRPHRPHAPFCACQLSASRPLSFQTNYHDYNSSVTERQTSIMLEETQKILEKPEGMVELEAWWTAEDLLFWWANQRTPQSVTTSFLLFERLFAEQKTLMTRGDGNTRDATAFLNSRDLMCALVVNWQHVYKSQVRPKRDNRSSNREDSNNNAVISPQELLLKLDGLCAEIPTLVMSGKALTVILDCTLHLCKQQTSIEAAALCEGLWDRMVGLHYKTLSSKNTFWPQVHSLNSVLSAWATVVRPDRSQALFERVQKDHPGVVRPDGRSYNTLMSAYANSGNGHAAEAVLNNMHREWQYRQEERQTQQQQQQHKTSTPDYYKEYSDGDYDEDEESSSLIQPTIVTWNIAMSAWAKSPDPDAAHRAQSLLARMYDPYNEPAVKPTLQTLNTVLTCWSRRSNEDNADRCLKLLEQMKDLYAAGELESPPDYISYGIVLNAFAKSKQPQKAEELFDEMFRLFMQHGHTHLKPNLRVLTSLVEAWARAGHVNRALTVHERIRELHKLGFLHTGPDLTSYNVMIASLFYGRNNFPNAAAKADSLLQEMRNDPNVQPDLTSFALVLQTWLATPNGLLRARAIAREAMDIYRTPGKVNSSSEYDAVKVTILAFCKAIQPAFAQDILMELCELAKEKRSPPPDLGAFGSVVTAWYRSKDPNAAIEAYKLVETMKRLNKAGVVRCWPDLRLYKPLIACLCESEANGAAKRAYAILTELRSVALERREMLDLATPDYSSILALLSRSGMASLADDLLRQIGSDFEKKLGKAAPSTESYNIVLSAWAKSKLPESAEKADALFLEMKRDQRARCTLESYNSVLKCWASSNRPEAVDRINELLDEMNAQSGAANRSISPNAASYGCLIEALVRIGDPAKAKAVLESMAALNIKPEPKHLDCVEQASTKLQLTLKE